MEPDLAGVPRSVPGTELAPPPARTCDALATVVAVLAARRPVVAVIDDLHLADDGVALELIYVAPG